MPDKDDLTRRRSHLSPEKQALLKQWTHAGGGRGPRKTAIPRRARQSAIPLSFAQQRLWFIEHLLPGSAAYTISTALRLSGPLQIALLERSIAEIVRRHEALRTFFASRTGEALQSVLPDLRIPLRIISLAALKAETCEATLRQLLTAEAATPFVFPHAPLLRVSLLRLDDEEHALLLTIHHIIFDGWSLGVFLRELMTLYTAFLQSKPSPLPELPVHYPDFALWQRDWLQGEALEELLAYWKQQLANAPALLELPTDYPRPPVQSFRGAQITFLLPPGLVARLHALCQQQRVTLFMLLLAAFQTLLFRYSGQEDILVGSPIAGRTRAEIENVIGFFVNTLVLRTDLSGNPTFNELVERVRRLTLDAYAHQDIPFEKLVEVLQPGRDMSYTPLFQVMLTFVTQTSAEKFELPGLVVRPLEVYGGSALFDLRLALTEERQGLTGMLEYRTELFTAASMQRLVAHFQVVLEQIAADPRQRIADLPILTAGERQLLLDDWCQTVTSAGPDLCLHQPFETQADLTPDAIAVVFQDEQLTYQAVNARANRLARHLNRLGVRAETCVGVCMERSSMLVLALLAILKAGGAYVPLDPTYPAERRSLMIQDACLPLIVTQERMLAILPHHGTQVLCLETCLAAIEQESGTNLPAAAGPKNLAYLLYTSGSTGKPKGVMIPHRGIENRLDWMQDTYQLNGSDRVLQKTPLSFDVSVWELFWPLRVGACLILAEPEGQKDSAYLRELIAEQQITVIHFVPSMLRVFLEEPHVERCHSLRTVLCSGEVLPYTLQERFFTLFQAELHNLYGPTEASIDVTFWACQRESPVRTVPIGRPIANTQIYLLDRALQPVPIGMPGKLSIGGTGLARGYLGCPELSAERFLPHPFGSPGERIYHTGDLARYLPDGSLEFLGRVDNQVKLRGLRIELGEIEATLRQHALVEEALAVVHGQAPDEQQLIGYVVPARESTLVGQLSTTDLPDEKVAHWGLVFDEAYSQSSLDQDPLLNFVGWNSSFSRAPIPQEQMLEWVEQTTVRIRALEARCVLEIGCGTGLLLFRLAPHCELYVGIDASSQALRSLRTQLARPEYQFPQVQVYQHTADEKLPYEGQTFDLLILNSVVQYFPSCEYFLKVLEQVLPLVRPGGSIFIGDVRNLLLLEAFHSAVELYNAPASLSSRHLRQRVRKRIAQEEELLIHPTFFRTLCQKFPQIGHTQVQVKRGRAHNELTCFRYDVTLHIRPTPAMAEVILWRDWHEHALTLPQLSQLLRTGPDGVGVAHIPNARLHTALLVCTQIEAHDTVAALQQELEDSRSESGVDPEALWRIGEELGYHVEISWSMAYADGGYDALFHRHAALMDDSPEPLHHQVPPARSAETYTNHPLQNRLAQQVLPILNHYVKEHLPGYMLPAALVLLPALPLLPNGKADRQALPEPWLAVPEREEESAASQNPMEEQLALIWAHVLGRERVGIHQNYFALGGDSIRSIQIVTRARRAGLHLTPRQLFEHQTIAELAAATAYDPALFNEQLSMETPAPLASTQNAAGEGQESSRTAFVLAGLDQQTLVRLRTHWPDIEDIYPLSPMQEEMLAQYQHEPGRGLYIIHQVLPFQGIHLDIPAFEQAWQQVVDRHAVLRTSFLWENLARPLQVVHRQVHISLEHADLRDLPEGEQNRRLHTYIQTARHQSFILTSTPQMRLALFRYADTVYQFVWIFNYMHQDGWSFPLILQDFFAWYMALTRGRQVQLEPRQPYRNYIAWCLQQNIPKAQAFWRAMLKNLTLQPVLVNEHQWQHFTRQGDTFLRQEARVLLTTTTRLAALARQHQLTLNTVLQGAWALLLARYGKRDDILFGSIVSGRPGSLEGVEDMVGFFNTIVPVRARIVPEMFLLPWLTDLQAQQAEARQYEYSTLAAMRAAGGLPAGQRVFESYLVFENFPFAESVGLQLDAWKTGKITALAQTEHPLRVEIVPASTLWIGMSYYQRLLSSAHIAQILEDFQQLLASIASRPGKRLASFLYTQYDGSS